MEFNFENGFDPKEAKNALYCKQWFREQIAGLSEQKRNDIIDWYDTDLPLLDVNGYRLVMVGSKTGEEGGGEHLWCTFAICQDETEIERYHGGILIKNAVAYIQITGFYDSYSGSEWYWDSPELVTPKVVTQVIFD